MKKFIIVLFSALMFTSAAFATESSYFKDKIININLPVGAGGAFSAYTLTIIPFLKKHIPGNPTVVMQNKPGGGGFRVANYMYNHAPKDGTAIGMVFSETSQSARISVRGVRFDPTKFVYLGGGSTIRGTITIRKDLNVRTLQDVTRRRVVVGSTRAAGMGYFIPLALNHYFGTKFKVVTGYKGMAPIDSAVENGELDGRVTAWEGTKSTRRYWLEKDYVVHLGTVSLTREPDLPNIPTVIEIAPNEEAKKVFTFLSGIGTLGRVYFTPPGTDPVAIKILRRALVAAYNDPGYRKSAASKFITVEPVDYRVIEKDVKRVMGTPQSIVDLTKKVVGLR